MELCTGCGAVTPSRHPIGGVKRDRETGQFEVFPVCDACWKDPTHRKVRLAMHFFQRDYADIAVQHAGKGSIG